MFVDKWKPVFAPELETGAEPEPQTPPTEELPSGPGSGRSELRQQLEKNFEADRRRDTQERQPQRRKPQRSASAEQYRAQTEEAETGEEVETQETPETKPPEGWTKEAKAEWANVPPLVQEAILKRETDTSKGVEELKSKWTDLDKVLGPRREMIRQHGHTEAQAVNQLFAWFDALSADRQRLERGQPAQAFLALAQSFGIDPRTVFGAPQQQQQQQQAAPQPQPGSPKTEQTPAAEIPDWFKSFQEQQAQQLNALQNAFGQKLGTLEQTFNAQSQAKTEEILSAWSKDKPYFEEVRQLMGRLIASHAVPPLPNGAADLDKAYDMALWGMPDVRAKIQAEQQAKAEAERKAKIEAERKAQSDQADKARRANVSLQPGAPGAPVQPGKKGAKGKSVRESLMEAMDEYRT